MASPLPLLLFALAAIAVVVGQVMILRSTARAWRAASSPVPPSERVFAWAPALALAVVLWLSWRALSAPPTTQGEYPAATVEART